ncbi:MAG: hypothetical protein U5J62_07585 [Desulfurivibrio sp.]|nr:hypothetical protein [Desulfurivibrio sp.]
MDPLTGAVATRSSSQVTVYPRPRHFVTSKERQDQAIETIKAELNERLAELHANKRLLEAQRLEQRTMFDLEMLQELGYCHGIENYSPPLDPAGTPGAAATTLLDYFPDDFLADHRRVPHHRFPSCGGMYNGDRSRKQTLVDTVSGYPRRWITGR